jgi:hypothetical protein
MRFQRRGGRKRIVAPDGRGGDASDQTRPTACWKALAQAWRWQKLLDDGVYAST